MSSSNPKSIKYNNNYHKDCKFLISLLTLLICIYPSNVLASYPGMSFNSGRINLNYDDCKIRAINAAKLILATVRTPLEREYDYQILGSTAETQTTLFCVKQEQGSEFILMTSSSRNDYLEEERKSVHKRILDYMYER